MKQDLASIFMIRDKSFHYFRYEFYALGSDCVFQLYAETEALAHAASAEATREVFRIEARYSRYRADSELSRINAVAGAGGSIDVDPETATLLDYAYACHRVSDGLFDITSGILRRAWDFSSDRIPGEQAIAAILPLIGLDKIEWKAPTLRFDTPGMELDLGGFGKEYAADRASDVLKKSGINSGLIDLGGDIRVVGPHPDGSLWRLGVCNPRTPGQPLALLDLKSGALATSGDYERYIEVDAERYCHILNPRTGWPARGLTSVSVICEECLVAGTLATIAMLKGPDGARWLNTIGVRSIVVDENGAVGGTEPLAEIATPRY